MRALLRPASLVAARRLAGDWRLQGAVGLGMALAVTLMASGVIYSELLRESALQHTLATSPADDVNYSIRAFGPLDRAVFSANNRYVEQQAYPRLRPYLRGRSALIETPTFYFVGRSEWEGANSERPRGHLQYHAGLAELVRVVEGRLPQDTEGEVEAVLDAAGAAALGVVPGDVVEMYPAILKQEAPLLPVRVVGTIEPLDLTDERWYAPERRFAHEFSGAPVTPMFVALPGLFGQVVGRHPGVSTDFVWHFVLDREVLRADDVAFLQDTLRSLDFGVRLNLADASVRTGLDRVLDRYRTQLLLARIPLFLLVTLIVGTLFYYLFLVAGLLARVRSPEIALLKSRGATTAQIEVLAVVEGLMLALPAVVLGPLLAVGVVVLAGRFADFNLGGVDTLSTAMSPQAFLVGAAGGLLAVGVFAGAAFGSARRSIVEARRALARPPRAPLLHRYYVDVLVLGFIAFLWWQMRQRGSFLVRPLGEEGMSLDLSLLLGPVLGVLAVGLLVLRFLPLVLGLMARLAEPVGPMWLVQALKRVARDPVPAGTLVVLLLLSTSLGVVGAAFSATLEQSQRDQALYAAGADLRVTGVGPRGDAWVEDPAELVRAMPGVTGATSAVRSSSTALTVGFGVDTEVLSVDPEGFAEVAWFRDDFASPSLGGLMSALRDGPPPPAGIPVPPDAESLAVSVLISRPSASTTLVARLTDADGRPFDVPLGRLEEAGWRRLSAPLEATVARVSLTQISGSVAAGTRSSRFVGVPATPPYTLHTLHFTPRGTQREPGVLLLDDLTAEVAGGQEVMLADFADLSGWHAIQDYRAPGLVTLEPGDGSGPGGAVLSWGPGTAGLMGVYVGPVEEPLRVVASEGFLSASDAHVGDTALIAVLAVSVPVRIEAAARYFPTMGSGDAAFVLFDREWLTAFVVRHRQLIPRFTQEVWASTDGRPIDAETVRADLLDRGYGSAGVVSAGALLDAAARDPLVTAGWAGLLSFSFLTLVVASTSGLMLYTYFDARERQTEFALLRGMGFSKGQVSGMVWLNVAIIGVVGVGLGTWAGELVGRSLLPLVEIAEGGARLTPPMVLRTSWGSLAVAYGVMAGISAASVAALTWAISRLELQRVLRLGEA